MKPTFNFLLPVISFIVVILYILLRYYMRTDYKMSVDHTTFIISILIISFFWNNGGDIWRKRLSGKRKFFL